MEAELDELRGRCQALELIVAVFMAQEVDGRPDALKALGEQWDEMRASLQLPEREVGERADRAWEATIWTLERLFHNAAEKVKAAG